MPIYVYHNEKTGELEEHSHRISEMDSFLEENPHLTRKITTVGFTRNSGIGTANKPDSGFRDVLKSIKKASGKDNSINTF